MFRTSTDSYRKRLFAAFLVTLALYCMAGVAFALLPKVAVYLSTGGAGGGSGRGSGLIILGVESGSGAAEPGGMGETEGPDRKGLQQAETTSANDALRDDAPNAPDGETVMSESAITEATGAMNAGNASRSVGSSGPGGAGSGEGTGETGNPGYGDGGGSGSGGSFVDAAGDATTTPFISWIDRSIRKRLYYPEKARLRNLEGTVTLGMAVPADGSRCEVILAKSSGHDVLDHAAISLLRSLFPAKVAPGKDFSAPVRIRYTLADN